MIIGHALKPAFTFINPCANIETKGQSDGQPKSSQRILLELHSLARGLGSEDWVHILIVGLTTTDNHPTPESPQRECAHQNGLCYRTSACLMTGFPYIIGRCLRPSSTPRGSHQHIY